MASLSAFTPAQEQAAFVNVSAKQHRLPHSKSQNKWVYLLSDSLTFSDKQQQAIRLSKPNSGVLVQCLEKIITGGQCATLFVEEMELDDINVQRLKQLSRLHQVSLVNLVVDNMQSGELLRGPW